jgi:3-deoxy-D-manno-octulosonate 8-phosphate phosphatase (KDO 8-P phosphatase)
METIKHFVLDVDGVLTDGRFYYSAEGKVMKAFGPDDSDALLLLKPYVDICVVTGDRRGFDISKKRIVDDMGLRLELVSTFERVAWMKENGFQLGETIYMGDGIFDAMVFDAVAYGIAPANAFHTTKAKANFVTGVVGGDSAVAEACLHILEKFFTPFDPLHVSVASGEWGSKKPETM